MHPCLHIAYFENACLGDINGTSFMCPTSITTYSEHKKSFMEFGIKRSNETLSYMLVEIVSLSE